MLSDGNLFIFYEVANSYMNSYDLTRTISLNPVTGRFKGGVRCR